MIKKHETCNGVSIRMLVSPAACPAAVVLPTRDLKMRLIHAKAARVIVMLYGYKSNATRQVGSRASMYNGIPHVHHLPATP
jgi:hypothetical protein